MTIRQPGMLDFTGRAKWDAWNSQKGMDSEDAKAGYVNALYAQIEKYDPKE